MECCPNCGQKLPEAAVFCPRCGASLQSYAPGAEERRRNYRFQRREEKQRGRQRDEGLWGGASFFAFLLVVGLTFSAYPDLITRIASYLNEMVAYGGPVLPPRRMGQPLIYFLDLSGTLGIILGAIRLALGRSPRSGIGNILGAMYAFFLARSLTLLYRGTITGSILVLYAILGAVAVMILTAIAWVAVRAYGYRW